MSDQERLQLGELHAIGVGHKRFEAGVAQHGRDLQHLLSFGRVEQWARTVYASQVPERKERRHTEHSSVGEVGTWHEVHSVILGHRRPSP